MGLFEEIKQLYDEEMYDNLVQLVNIILPQLEADSEMFSLSNQYQLFLYYGDALYYTKNYAKAEVIYQKNLSHVKKNMNKTKRKSLSNASFDYLDEIDIKYKLYLCYFKMEKYSKAIQILEDIPPKQRTARINSALGELYKIDKSLTHATSCFKEVLKESPFSLYTIINLIKLDVKVSEIISIVTPALSSIPQMSWLKYWIRAQSFIYSNNVSQAIPILKNMIESPQFKDNVEILISLGEALYYNGEYKNAINYFKKAYFLDSLTIRGLDYYAACLAKESQDTRIEQELETLANKMIHYCESNESSKYAEPWLVLAYYCFITSKRESKAYYFVLKACSLSNNSVESLLLKGAILIEAKSNTEAINCFQEAYNKAPYRFEAMKCLVEVYLLEKRKTNALNIANVALKTLSSNPRTLTLYATVLLYEPSSTDKKSAKMALEKALKLDSSYLEAVYKLSSLYIEEKSFDKAIEILQKGLEGNENNSKIHKLLSECYSEKNEQDKAAHHRTIASRLESNFKYSNELSQRLEQHIAANEPTLELEVDDIQPSDEEIDESETEIVWSDDN